MTLRLILIRHPKSSWDSPGLDDHSRPLNKRGRRGADAIGRWLAAHELYPDRVIHSTAERAVETWGLIAPHIEGGPSVRTEARLYHAAPLAMLDVLQTATAPVVMMVGHNPGCALFVAGMCRMPSSHPDFNRYPTCGTCILDFDGDDWGAIEPGTGEIVDFIVPRQLLS